MAVVDPHYLWAFGHLVMLLGAAYIILRTVLFRSLPVYTYRAAYTGALLSYTIVVLKSLGYPSANRAWLARAFADENVQYMVLAVYWWISKPIGLTVLPFATFSLFHVLTFLRTNVIPKVAPSPAGQASAQGGQPQAPAQQLARTIQLWVKNNYDAAMRFVAFAELGILARVVFGALTFRTSFLTPLFLAHFLRLRYHASPFTRQAVSFFRTKIDDVLLPRGGPVAQGWTTAKGLVERWGGGAGRVPQAVPTGTRGAAAGTARAGAGAGAGAGGGAGAGTGAGAQRRPGAAAQ